MVLKTEEPSLIEWSSKSKYNSFNSYKGLAYYEHYKKVVAWMEGKGELPPPVECSLDPIMQCNNNCYYCNSQRYLRTNPLAVHPLTYPEMHDLITYLAEWGVQGVCFGGGGESMLNDSSSDMMSLANRRGMQTAVVTNGSMLWDASRVYNLLNCRWVGISLDAGDAETYKQIRRVDMFDKVVRGIERLVDAKRLEHSKVDIAIKVLVLPENYDKLYDICLLAKSLGVNDFHIRPVDLERKDFEVIQRLNLDIPLIHEQFRMCHEIEDGSFHVYTVMHKYDEQFHVKHDFNKCLASPLVLQCCTDGNAYVCVDHRLEERFKLGSWKNIKEWWGSDRHRELVKGIRPHEECARCTWCEYQKQIKDTVIEDKMCLAFP